VRFHSVAPFETVPTRGGQYSWVGFTGTVPKECTTGTEVWTLI